MSSSPVSGPLERKQGLAAVKMAHQAPGQTLQTTALVHEAYLQLTGGVRSMAGSGALLPRRRRSDALHPDRERP